VYRNMIFSLLAVVLVACAPPPLHRPGDAVAPIICSTVDTAPAAPLVVPDVRNQAFVFAKGTLGDARTQSLWGIGAKSAATAQQALDEVKAKAKS